MLEEAAPAQAAFASDKLIAHLVAQAVQQMTVQQLQAPQPKPFDRNETPLGSVVISGTGLGLPGAEKAVMDPDNALRILRGEQFVDLIPERFRKEMLKKRITRAGQERRRQRQFRDDHGSRRGDQAGRTSRAVSTCTKNTACRRS